MISSILRHARLLMGPLPLQKIRIDGCLKESGDPVRILYSGSNDSLAFITGLLFSAHEVAPGQGTQDCSLVIAERPPAWRVLENPAADIRIPAWINQYIDLAAARASGHALFSRHLRREVERQTRRSGYALDFSTADADRLQFFHDLYRPYVQARFDHQAILVAESDFMQQSAGQSLARLHSNGVWIAGMLLKRRGNALKFGWFGARGSPPPPGASEVLDALVIQWAAAQEFEKIVLGHSRPSLRDGVLRYKRRFGARIRATPFPQPQIGIDILKCGDALARRLDAAALIRVQDANIWMHRVDACNGVAAVRVEAFTDDRP